MTGGDGTHLKSDEGSVPKAIGTGVAGALVGIASVLYLSPRYEGFAPIGVVLFTVAIGIRVARRAAKTDTRSLVALAVGIAFGVMAGSALEFPRGVEIVVIVLANVVSIGPVVLTYLSGREKRELDRAIFTDAAAAAFFVTMLALIAYAFAEAWFDAPRVLAIGCWAFGMAAWFVSTIVIRRRYR